MTAINRLEDIFLNAEYLRVLYFLARENPRVAIKTVSKKLRIKEELTQSMLLDIAYWHLARNEEEKGFTLTDEGLAMLYNFHKNFVEK